MMSKEILDYMHNEEFVYNLLTPLTEKDGYITNAKPVYTLKECLDTVDFEILKSIYFTYKFVMAKEKKLKNTDSRQEMVKILEKEILNSFQDFLLTITKEMQDIFYELAKAHKISKSSLQLLTVGFLYGFKEKNQSVFIAPNELIELFLEYQKSDLKVEMDLKKVETYSTAYLMMNGIIPKQELQDILIHEYGLEISQKDLDAKISKQFLTFQNEYYSVFPNDDLFTKIPITSLIEWKKEKTIRRLNENDLNDYLDFLHEFSNDLEKALKKENRLFSVLISIQAFQAFQDPEDAIAEFDLSKSEQNKVINVIEKYQDFFRYWDLNGRTLEEDEKEYLLEIMPFPEKPKKTDLLSCLDLVKEEMFEIITSNYNVRNKKELVNQIIKQAQKEIENLDSFEIECLLSSNNEEVNDFVLSAYLEWGMFFLYEEDKKIKCIIPNEILDILKSFIQEEYSIDNFVYYYMEMNGVIEKEKLKELLKVHHNIDISTSELDDIVIQNSGIILNKKYYSIIHDLSSDEALSFIQEKQKFGKYKEFSIIHEDKEEEFKDYLTNLLSTFIAPHKIEEIFTIVIFLTKNAIFNEESLNMIFQEFGIQLPKNQKKKIVELYKEYKKYIGVWKFNGYPITEQSCMSIKKEKIGRNDPCPCGSGKKYKNCCGK